MLYVLTSTFNMNTYNMNSNGGLYLTIARGEGHRAYSDIEQPTL